MTQVKYKYTVLFLFLFLILFYFITIRFFFVICATLQMTDSWHGNHLRWCANRMNGTTGALLSQTNQSYCRLVCHFLLLSDEGLESHAGEHGFHCSLFTSNLLHYTISC